MNDFFNLTPELHNILKEELEGYLIAEGYDWVTIRAPKKVTGLPIGWRMAWDICNKPTNQLNITTLSIFGLLAFFGYELKSFVFSKKE